jgi:transcriptional regulator with XRE-family HTH domain
MPDPLKALGSAVRALRKERGLTQEQLAELCDRHPVYISELERGLKNPSIESIIRLCAALKTTPGNLMDLAFEKNVTDRARKQFSRLIAHADSKKLQTLYQMSRIFLEA